MTKKSFLIIVALVQVLFIIGPKECWAVSIKETVHEYTLPNGMKWMLVQRKGVPIFSAIIAVRVGGMDEGEGETGIAHFLEHMAFKGTKDISGPELWNAFIGNGATGLNASTGKDLTSYYSSMPSSKLELWLYLNSEMIRHSILREFYKERDVVLEERRDSIENNPSGLMFSTLLATAFKNGPYSWPTLGSVEDLQGFKPENLENFKKKRYIPQRMTGAIVGDIDIEQTKAMIDKYFSPIPRGKTHEKSLNKSDVQKEERRAVVEFEAMPSIMIAYHKPTLPTWHDYVFDVLDYLLCDGKSAVLPRVIVKEKRLARSLHCASGSPGARLNNLFLIVADPLEGHSVAEIEKAVIEELERIKKESFADAKINTARNNIVKDFIFGMTKNMGLARNLAYFQTIAGDWRYLVTHEDKIGKVTAKDIRAIAKKYFVNTNKTVVELKSK